MPINQRSDLHVDTLLSDVAMVYLQNPGNFAFPKVFPIVPVTKQSDLYKTFSKGDMNRRGMKKRARSTKAARYTFGSSNTRYNCDVKAEAYAINDQDRGNADPVMMLETRGARFLSQQAMIEQEAVFSENFLVTGVWDKGLVGTAGTAVAGTSFKKWSDALSTPIEDFRAARTLILQNTGFAPNKATLTKDTWDQLVDHPDLIDRIKYGQTPGSPAIVTRQGLAALFELDEVIVTEAVYNTTPEGEAAVMDFIAKGSALLSYAPAAASVETPSAGYTFQWTGMPNDGEGRGVLIYQYYLPEYRDTILEIELAQDQKATGTDLGFLFTGTV